MTKAILWDMDGTLLDTLEDICGAVNACMAHFGRPAKTTEEVKAATGNGAACLLEQCLGGRPENFEEIHRWYREYFSLHSNETSKPYPGIPQAAEALRAAGWKMGIVSNKPDSATKLLWAYHFPDFDLAMGEGPGIPRKPAPDMVYAAMKALGAEKAVYIGDSEVDVATAKAAGLPCISVTWGLRTEQELLDAGAKVLCRRAEDLPGLLEEL